VKLLLDEMHAPLVAVGLRARGHDVVAVKERPDMVGLPDRELLLAATAETRALVTENVKDFAALHKTGTAAAEQHAGIVFTHPRRFPRHARNHIAAFTDALARFLDEHGRTLRNVESFIWWLETSRR
jgi:hypothetical protein